MIVLLQMQFQTVAVFGRVSAIGTSVLIDVGVTLHVGIQHGFVDASVIAFRALEWLGPKVVPQMVL